MKLILLLLVSSFVLVSFAAPIDQNPEDVDDVKPPIEEEKEKIEEKIENEVKTTTLPSINLLVTTPTNETLQSTTNYTSSTIAPAPVEVAFVTAAAKTEVEKKEELLTGKEETPAPKLDLHNIDLSTTLVPETRAPERDELKNEETNAEDSVESKDNAADKANAAPEFEVKQDVEGGKGEEDPDANVDKPAQVDPPKDEADGAAKEDRETPPIGAEGLHEAVEEARGNPAPGVPAAELQKKDSADEEQTFEAQPAIRPNRVDYSLQKENQAEFQRIQASEDESTGFMSFFLIGTFLVVCIYIIQHNKKKILGMMFEGRNGRSTRRGGNVKYRRLSQNDS